MRFCMYRRRRSAVLYVAKEIKCGFVCIGGEECGFVRIGVGEVRS